MIQLNTTTEFVSATGGTILTCAQILKFMYLQDQELLLFLVLILQQLTTVDYLVVAGGGGGGGGRWCWGGAGGFRASNGTASGYTSPQSGPPSPLGARFTSYSNIFSNSCRCWRNCWNW